MAQLTKRERVDAALKGEVVDHVPVSAWRHFIDEERQPDGVVEVRVRDQHVLDARLGAEGQGARHRARLEEDVTVDEEAGQAPLRHAATVATEDLEEHAARGCQALSPCRIVTGAVAAPSWIARRCAGWKVLSVSGIYPTAHREKSSLTSVFVAFAWRAE